MSYHHLTTFERGSIESLYKEGHTVRYIAAQVGRSPSTISRELGRCSDGYQAKQAQWRYQKARENSRWQGKATPQVISLIEQHLALAWSPEQIANTVGKGLVGTKTIYNWLYAHKLLGGDLRALRHKGKGRDQNGKRGYTQGRSIDKRPKEVANREQFGHWEMDTVWSRKGVSACLGTFLERKSRFYTAVKQPDKSAAAMEQSINRLIDVLPPDAFLTATCDRGKEFTNYKEIEAKHTGVQIYFAHAFHAWEKGSNENSNGLLREFFPKGTDFSRVTQEQVATVLRLLNSRPRKVLNWQTPTDVFLHDVFHLT